MYDGDTLDDAGARNQPAIFSAVRLRRKDGVELPCNISLFPFVLTEGLYTVAVVTLLPERETGATRD